MYESIPHFTGRRRNRVSLLDNDRLQRIHQLMPPVNIYTLWLSQLIRNDRAAHNSKPRFSVQLVIRVVKRSVVDVLTAINLPASGDCMHAYHVELL